MHPVVRPWQETEVSGEKRRSIKGVCVVVLSENAAITHPAVEDVRLDLVGGRFPTALQFGFAADGGKLRCAIHCHPAHDLGRDVVLRLAAGLPDPLVRLGPHAGRALGLCLDDRPQPPR